MNRRIFWGGVIAGGALALYLTPFTLFMTARGAERAMDWWAKRG